MSIPESVRVGPWTYSVVTDPDEIAEAAEGNVPEGGTWAAFSDHERLIIGVNEGNSESVLKVSVLHELMHCCLRISGAWPTQYARLLASADYEDHGVDVEEFMVAGTSAVLLGVLRDNLALTDWLTSP